tara:strand:+ start:668 stop:835 length:168 start_codon:yes stop_codon:yes gene_type:complete
MIKMPDKMKISKSSAKMFGLNSQEVKQINKRRQKMFTRATLKYGSKSSKMFEIKK